VQVSVTKEQFFAVINELNVHPRPTGKYPYVSQWEMQDGSRALVGVSAESGYTLHVSRVRS
jgi:hypothetical protein